MRKAILAPMLVLAILPLTPSLIFMAIGDGTGSENYAVIEYTIGGSSNGLTPGILSVVNSAGGRAVIYQFPTDGGFADDEFTNPDAGKDIMMDTSGNYIVTLIASHVLLKISPAGVMTVVYNFSADAAPSGFTIDSEGNYIVCEGSDTLSRITPDGERAVIYQFPVGSIISDVKIDSSGNYIILQCPNNANKFSKITPAGERTVVYQFEGNPLVYRFAIDSSGNYIVTELMSNSRKGVLSKVTPDGVRTVVYNFTQRYTWPVGVAIDPSGNYIVAEGLQHTISRITPAGERTVVYEWSSETEPGSVCIYVSTATQLIFSDITENGLTAAWTQSADPFFAGYQIYRSSAQGELGSLIGTNTNVADTSLAVTDLSPWTTYYFTLRILGANGAYVDSGQRSVTTAKAFWQQDWFQEIIVVVVMVAIVAIAIYVVYSRSKKKAQVT